MYTAQTEPHIESSDVNSWSLVSCACCTFGSQQLGLRSFSSISTSSLIKGRALLSCACYYLSITWTHTNTHRTLKQPATFLPTCSFAGGKLVLTAEVTGPAEHLGSVYSSRISVRHIQLACYWVSGQVVPVSRVVAEIESDKKYLLHLWI